MKTDLEIVRELLEKLEIPYITIKQGETLVLSIRESPKISFSFQDGQACSIYNDW